MSKSTKIEQQITKSHEFLLNQLKEYGYTNYEGGIQLFTNQFRSYYSVSVNYMGTGLRVNDLEIDVNDFVDDELIKVYNTFECML